jgi:hypothetical protein
MEPARHPFPVSSTVPHYRRTKSESQVNFRNLVAGQFPVTRLHIQVAAGLAAQPTRPRYSPSSRPSARNIVILFSQRRLEPLLAQWALCGLSFSCGATSETHLSCETFLRKPSLRATTRTPFRQPPESEKGPIYPSSVTTTPWRGVTFQSWLLSRPSHIRLRLA